MAGKCGRFDELPILDPLRSSKFISSVAPSLQTLSLSLSLSLWGQMIRGRQAATLGYARPATPSAGGPCALGSRFRTTPYGTPDEVEGGKWGGGEWGGARIREGPQWLGPERFGCSTLKSGCIQRRGSGRQLGAGGGEGSGEQRNGADSRPVPSLPGRRRRASLRKGGTRR